MSFCFNLVPTYVYLIQFCPSFILFILLLIYYYNYHIIIININFNNSYNIIIYFSIINNYI